MRTISLYASARRGAEPVIWSFVVALIIWGVLGHLFKRDFVPQPPRQPIVRRDSFLDSYNATVTDYAAALNANTTQMFGNATQDFADEPFYKDVVLHTSAVPSLRAPIPRFLVAAIPRLEARRLAVEPKSRPDASLSGTREARRLPPRPDAPPRKVYVSAPDPRTPIAPLPADDTTQSGEKRNMTELHPDTLQDMTRDKLALDSPGSVDPYISAGERLAVPGKGIRAVIWMVKYGGKLLWDAITFRLAERAASRVGVSARGKDRKELARDHAAKGMRRTKNPGARVAIPALFRAVGRGFAVSRCLVTVWTRIPALFVLGPAPARTVNVQLPGIVVANGTYKDPVTVWFSSHTFAVDGFVTRTTTETKAYLAAYTTTYTTLGVPVGALRAHDAKHEAEALQRQRLEAELQEHAAQNRTIQIAAAVLGGIVALAMVSSLTWCGWEWLKTWRADKRNRARIEAEVENMQRRQGWMEERARRIRAQHEGTEAGGPVLPPLTFTHGADGPQQQSMELVTLGSLQRRRRTIERTRQAWTRRYHEVVDPPPAYRSQASEAEQSIMQSAQRRRGSGFIEGDTARTTAQVAAVMAMASTVPTAEASTVRGLIRNWEADNASKGTPDLILLWHLLTSAVIVMLFALAALTGCAVRRRKVKKQRNRETVTEELRGDLVNGEMMEKLQLPPPALYYSSPGSRQEW